ncbi:GlsB/YeaQ/YmgE family stress response membrane protein [Rhodobacteraceae bacterium]|nr:GlsB/YeaQ/YmgE family stress response membrane protein [Paracoccaceae bacterium]
MEDLFSALSGIVLFVLIVIGALAGFLASVVTGGRHRLGYILIGIVGAVATPFIIAALGLGALAAGGILAVLVAALVGAVIVLAIGKAILD